LQFSLAAGQAQLQFLGEPGFYYLLQYSEDLVSWTTWTNATAAVSPAIFVPFGWPGSSPRFYRAKSVQ
jgi:hypothetical protein